MIHSSSVTSLIKIVLHQPMEIYSVLPFSMRVESSEDNFYKFLEYIETSGNLDNKVRLMNVTDVAINISTEDEELISYNLELNAYFQK